MQEKIPIGTRVTGRVDMAGLEGPTEAVMKVVGYDGIKFVITEVLEDVGRWKKGHISVWPAKSLTPREEVKHIPGEAEDGDGPAIGWMELGGLSLALTRDNDGALLVSFERAPDYPENWDVTVRVRKMPGSEDLWEGDIE